MRKPQRHSQTGSRRPAGQSLAEMAVAIPFMVLLLLGGLDASLMLANKTTAGYAVRQGARLAAELGGIQTNPTSTTGQIDSQIVQNVLAVAQSMKSVTLTEIDIYAPGSMDGVYRPSSDPVDQYFVSGGTSATPGIQTFPIQNRNQTPPGETSIGVRLVWIYEAPTGVFPSNIQLVDYAVMKAAPFLT